MEDQEQMRGIILVVAAVELVLLEVMVVVDQLNPHQ